MPILFLDEAHPFFEDEYDPGDEERMAAAPACVAPIDPQSDTSFAGKLVFPVMDYRFGRWGQPGETLVLDELPPEPGDQVLAQLIDGTFHLINTWPEVPARDYVSVYRVIALLFRERKVI